jgi:hypothetical protein
MRPITVIVILAALAIAATVLVYLRRRRIRDEYSLLWILMGVGIVVFAVFNDLVGRVARVLDVAYEPSLAFFLGFCFTLLLLFHYALEISRLSEQNKTLAQELGLIEVQLKTLQRANPTGSTDPELIPQEEESS